MKKLFRELDGYTGKTQEFRSEEMEDKVITSTLPRFELAKIGLVAFSSLLDETIPCNGIGQMRSRHWKSVRPLR